MSSIQEQMVAYLAPTIALHPIIAPQNAVPPYATYQRVANNINNVLSGPPSIDNVRIQIDVWADGPSGGYAKAQSLSRAVIAAMQAWPVQNILISDYDLYDQNAKMDRVLLEFSIWQ